MDLLVVRHAQPQRLRAANGAADPPLTNEGREQARALALWLTRDREASPARLFSSSMRRARETAQETADLCGIPIAVDERLAEFDLGATEYIPIELAGAAIHERVATAMQTGSWGNHKFDPELFQTRVAAAFADVVSATKDGGPSVVFCHGGVINSWLSVLIGRPHGMFFQPRYTCVSRLRIEDDGSIHLLSLNEMPHAHLMTAGARAFS